MNRIIWLVVCVVLAVCLFIAICMVGFEMGKSHCDRLLSKAWDEQQPPRFFADSTWRPGPTIANQRIHVSDTTRTHYVLPWPPNETEIAAIESMLEQARRRTREVAK